MQGAWTGAGCIAAHGLAAGRFGSGEVGKLAASSGRCWVDAQFSGMQKGSADTSGPKAII
jgi:hypothetical protein